MNEFVVTSEARGIQVYKEYLPWALKSVNIAYTGPFGSLSPSPKPHIAYIGLLDPEGKVKSRRFGFILNRSLLVPSELCLNDAQRVCSLSCSKWFLMLDRKNQARADEV